MAKKKTDLTDPTDQQLAPERLPAGVCPRCNEPDNGYTGIAADGSVICSSCKQYEDVIGAENSVAGIPGEHEPEDPGAGEKSEDAIDKFSEFDDGPDSENIADDTPDTEVLGGN